MHKRGFTLLEILVVVIIIGILASLALPQYMKTIRKARISEATSNIGSIRGAEIRYFQEYDALATDLGALDIENPNDVNKCPNAYFSYEVSGGSPLDMVITAKGKKPPIMPATVVVTYTASTGKIEIGGL